MPASRPFKSSAHSQQTLLTSWHASSGSTTANMHRRILDAGQPLPRHLRSAIAAPKPFQPTQAAPHIDNHPTPPSLQAPASSDVYEDANRYPCKFEGCPYIFHAKYKFDAHTRTHTGEKPYHCKCGKAFGRSDYLHKHVKTQHPDRYPEWIKRRRLGRPPKTHRQRELTPARSPPPPPQPTASSSRRPLLSIQPPVQSSSTVAPSGANIPSSSGSACLPLETRDKVVLPVSSRFGPLVRPEGQAANTPRGSAAQAVRPSFVGVVIKPRLSGSQTTQRSIPESQPDYIAISDSEDEEDEVEKQLSQTDLQSIEALARNLKREQDEDVLNKKVASVLARAEGLKAIPPKDRGTARRRLLMDAEELKDQVFAFLKSQEQ